MSRFTPQSASEWGAVAPIWCGIVGLTACLAFWMVTGKVEPAFLNIFGGILAAGAGAKVLGTFRSPPPPPIPPGDTSKGSIPEET